MILLLEYFNFKKKIFYLIKSENIIDKFYKNIFTIEYQKCSFFYIYLLIFLYLANYFLKVFQFYKIIYIKFLKLKIDSIKKLIKIITLVMYYSLYKNINL